MLNISVVLATYNGHAFILEQLQSIYKQSKEINEVIVIDDCSTDDTVRMVSDFISTNKLSNWKIMQNERNMGWKQNFINGFHLATGDVIFCADQDDIWCADKVLQMTSVLEEYPRVNVLACNIEPKYENGATRISKIYTTYYGKNRLEPVAFGKSILDVLRPGCAMCFRTKPILELLDCIWYEKLAHDAALWAVGIATDSAYILNETLMQFRRHGENNSPSNKKNMSSRLALVENRRHEIQQLIVNADVMGLSEEKRSTLFNVELFLTERISALKGGNIFKVLVLLRHVSYYGSLKTWMADVVSILKINNKCQ